MSKQTTNYGETSNQAINIVCEGTNIKGDITAVGDFRIDGALTGSVKVQGRLVVGPKGKIEGGIINCNSSEVSGLIKGKITVRELLSMKSSAQILGDIVAGKLSVEPGAVFSGTCEMKESNNYGTSPTK